MIIKKEIKKITLFLLFSVMAIPVMAQDKLASLAPVDRRMKTVDSIQLRHIIMNEALDNPSGDLYEEWDNRYAHRATDLPDSFLIDLHDFCMPTTSTVLTSNFGPRWGRTHKGLDIKVYIGDTIRSAFDGKVRIVNYEPLGYGKYVVIRHNNGLETIYGHMSKHLVEENQNVRAGDPIGLGGNTGRSTGSHLHFETRLCGVALNPAIMFDFPNQDVVADNYMFHKDSYERESSFANKIRGISSSKSYTGRKSGGNIRYHKVKRGETLTSIARKYGMTVNQLCKVNRIGKSKRIKAGQLLKYNK